MLAGCYQAGLFTDIRRSAAALCSQMQSLLISEFETEHQKRLEEKKKQIQIPVGFYLTLCVTAPRPGAAPNLCENKF